MLALSFRQPIYFVASDHIFRLGWLSRLLIWLVAPIPIVKSQLDLHAVRQLIQVRQEGGTTCLFPSGNRSFTGPEMPIPAATGKLIKHIRCPVLLYRFEGGYLTTPRWSRFSRRGKMTGKVVRELSVSEIESLSADRINQILAAELEGNPYQNPILERQNFKGRNLAEYLERVLFVCPSCRSFASLSSSGNQVSCGCGLQIAYKPDGWFELCKWPESENTMPADRPELENVDQWDIFQKKYLFDYLHYPENFRRHLTIPVFQDEQESIFEIERASRSIFLFKGNLALYSDRLEISGPSETISFRLSDLGRMSVHGSQVLQFHDSVSERVYEVKSDRPRSAYKYSTAEQILRDIRKKPSEV